MVTPVLLAAMVPSWIGTARIPRALAQAGFEVTLLAPPGSLAELSPYVARKIHLPYPLTPLQWTHAFADAVRGTSPRIVLACDDQSFILLKTVAELQPPGMPRAQHAQLAALVHDSLGDPAFYFTSIDKTLLPASAEALGVRMPPYALVSDLDEAMKFVANHGYPVVLKLGISFAGLGVAICADRDALARAFAELRRSSVADLGVDSDRMLLQAFIPGSVTYYGFAAWQGVLLAGFTTERVVADPPSKGPATVIRYYRNPEIRDFAEKLVRAFAMGGLLGIECIVHEQTGEPYLIEINRRVTPGHYRGAQIKVDLCAALHAALDGLPSPSRTDLDDAEAGIRCSFPQEWLRDPTSRWLRDYPVDVPWDEPEMLEAMLAMRHKR
jgi:predicted ATP-grasp superfamily ATP-dependent carboligase